MSGFSEFAKMSQSRPLRAAVAALSATTLCVCLTASPLAAYETDQYSPRSLPLADVVEQLNAQVNETLLEIADEWRGEPDPKRFARQVYKRLGGRHWVDRLERWAVRNDAVDKFHPRRRGSIYSGLPPWATRANFFFGVGPTIRVSGVLLGTDKLGHFVSQGWKYHKRYLRSRSVEHAVRLGVRNEASIFGSPATGTFSNADLVANYEGLRFYRSLFEEGVLVCIPHHVSSETDSASQPEEGEGCKLDDLPPIVEWAGGRAHIARPFDFRHHVNDYWDEALNPNRYDRLLRRRMLERLSELCPRFEENPMAWVSAEDDQLRRSYALLGLRDGTSHRLDRVCSGG